MESAASQTFRAWHVALSSLLKRPANPSDFVWLGRFRLLTLYSIFKGLLLLTVAVLSTRLGSLQSGTILDLTPSFWISAFLGMTVFTLLLIAGLIVASEHRTRSTGLLLLGASDLCVLCAIVYAVLLSNLILLLVVLVCISCTTLFLIERISRYASRYLKSSSELENMKNQAEMLLLQQTQNLVQAIERERTSLKREMHDGLLQELSSLSLQISMMIRRKSHDGALQLDETDVRQLETALRRAVVEARSVMNSMQDTRSALNRIDTLELPKLIV